MLSNPKATSTYSVDLITRSNEQMFNTILKNAK